MKIWVLEWFCSDSNSFLLEELFTTSDKAVSHVESKYPRALGYTQEVHSDGDISLYWSEYYKPRDERKYYEDPQFLIYLREVK